MGQLKKIALKEYIKVYTQVIGKLSKDTHRKIYYENFESITKTSGKNIQNNTEKNVNNHILNSYWI